MLELPALRQIRILKRGVVIGWKWAPYVYTSYVTLPRITQTEKKNTVKKETKLACVKLKHGSGWLLEAVIVVLLPISSGDGAVHAGALGADGVQYPLMCQVTSGGWRANMLM